MTRIHPFLLLAAVLLISPMAVRADLVFTLDPAQRTVTQGAEAFFTGTLTNTGTDELFLNSIDFNADPQLSGDSLVFLNNAPISLQASGTAGDSYTGLLFGVTTGSSTPFGDYIGSATISGGADSSTYDELGTQYFKVTVAAAPVPELGSFQISTVLAVICGLGVWRRGRRQMGKKLMD